MVPRARVPRGIYPADPFPARHWCDFSPKALDRQRGGGQRCLKIPGHVRLRPLFCRLQLDLRRVARACPRCSLQLAIDPHPMPAHAVRFQHRPKRIAVNRSLDCYLPARLQFLTRFAGQAQNCPSIDLRQRCVATNCGRRDTPSHSIRMISTPPAEPHLDEGGPSRRRGHESHKLVSASVVIDVSGVCASRQLDALRAS